MANTYTQIYIQIVLAVQGRQKLITAEHREELHKFITGIVQNRGHKLLAVFCMPDHAHILVGFQPVGSLSDLVRDIKAASSKFINEQRWIRGRFRWQEGFGAFSYSQTHIHTVIRYILNQEAHHSKQTFEAEYLDMLTKFEVEYQHRYLFDQVN
ncbi:MAG: IS200/IS605 family transposase [Bacteroidota bacterium]